MTDEEYNELYIEWAREKYHDPAIIDVNFSLGVNGVFGRSADVDAYVKVWVRRQEPQPFGRGGQIHEESDVFAIIRELSEFIIAKRG